MEANEISNNISNSKSDYKEDIGIYPGSKRIINWTFSSKEAFATEDEINDSYLNYNDDGYDYYGYDDKCGQKENDFNSGNVKHFDLSKFVSENSSTSLQETQQKHSNNKEEIMGKRAVTGEPNNNNQQPYTGSNQSNQQIGNRRIQAVGSSNKAAVIYGWRKQCLYFIIFLLMVLISVNLALTLWILKVLEVSKDGMGQMRIVEGGIQLDGQAIIVDELRTSHIKSRHGQPITFESSRNLTFNTRDSDGLLENQLFLGHDKFEIQSKKFRVADLQGRTLFYVDRDLVEIAAATLRVEGDGGVYFKDSIQTSYLKAEPGKDLKLESPTRSLELEASQDVLIQSKAGGIEVSSLNDIKFSSKSGSIRFDAEKIIISNMKISHPNKSTLDRSTDQQVYQVCVCTTSGKLFLAASHTKCANGSSGGVGESSVCKE